MSFLLDDIENLSTDSDDEEYIPEGAGGEVSPQSDVSGSADEDMLMNEDGMSPARKTKAKLKRKKLSRKRKHTVVNKEGGGDQEEDAKKEEEKEIKKARIDDLWASFKQGTSLPSSKLQDIKGKVLHDEATHPKKLKIQKTYDFAGEDIVVEKEVSADSKEALKYLQSCAESAKMPAEGNDKASLSQTTPHPPTPKQPGTIQTKTTSVRSGLSSVLQSLDRKKKKMTTLEKTGMDWMKYKKDEGLVEELSKNSKDGYLAKQDFLHWSDQKQFEQEKNERLKRFKRLH